MFQKVMKNLKNRWLRDGKAHVLTGICLIREGAGSSAKGHTLKFKSCMTLFEKADPNQKVFGMLLDKFFGGKRDRETLERL